MQVHDNMVVHFFVDQGNLIFFSSLDLSYCTIISSSVNLIKILSSLCIIQDNLLRKTDNKNLHSEFLQLLSMKCSYNLFGLEHVRCIFDHLLGDRFGKKHLEDSSVQLLLVRDKSHYINRRILKLVNFGNLFSIIIFSARPHPIFRNFAYYQIDYSADYANNSLNTFLSFLLSSFQPSIEILTSVRCIKQ